VNLQSSALVRMSQPPRHFLQQQSDYTICSSFRVDYGWRFDSHQNVFGQTGLSRIFC
jgi:hypothetical protein